MAQGLDAGGDRGHARCELPVMDQRDESGVSIEVLQLVLDVPVVHVHRNRSQLVGGEHSLEVLAPVEQVQAHEVARAHVLGGEMVRQPVGPGVELGVREPALLAGEGLVVGPVVDHQLPQVGQVEAHRHERPSFGSGFRTLVVRWAACVAGDAGAQSELDATAPARLLIAARRGPSASRFRSCPSVRNENDKPESGSAHASCPPTP